MKKFTVIVADPPWSFADSLKMSDVKRGAKANYDTMSISEIMGLPVNSLIADDGSVLALWVPSSLLQEGLDTMKTWGFTHKQTYVWVKTKKQPLAKISLALEKIVKQFKGQTILPNLQHILTTTCDIFNLSELLAFGMGRLFRQTHEICLIGTSNNKIYQKLSNKSQRSVSFGENLKHSAKPAHLQNSLEIMFPQTEKLELFARRKRDGWICLGNEVCDGEDIRMSLAKL